MNHTQQPIWSFDQFLSFVFAHPKRWLVPAAAVAILSGAYALLWPATWEASQALIIRDEAANSQERVGRFSHSDEMKTVQETILELVKSRGVLVAALKKVGPPADYRGPASAWPGVRDVADLRDDVRLTPPKGAEFGMTEVFYLKARAHERDRARVLAAAISDQLEASFQQLRDAKAQSMIDELVKAVKLARDDLAESTAQLTEIERQVGSDLAELRILHDASSGESALRRTITEIRNELRQARVIQKSSEELLGVLKDARRDPGRLVATPNRLLESQPALRRLKEGLVDAQLRTAQLQGSMSANHPLVQAAKEAELEIRRHLYNELSSGIGGLEVDLKLSTDRVDMLQEQLREGTGQLDRLAGLRAEYSNLVSETQNRGELLERAEQKLSEVRVTQATAKAASLIGRIDTPDTGIRPMGPRRSLIVLAGLAGGLIVGFGVVALTVPPVPSVPASVRPAAASTLPRRSPGGNGSTNAAIPFPGTTLSLKQALQKLGESNLRN